MTRRYHRWTPEEDDFLASNAHLGVNACTRAYNREFGRRNGYMMRRATLKRHANRLRVSMTRRATCTGCGRVMPRDTLDGLCMVCHERELASPASEQRASLMRRMRYTAEDYRAIEEARRRQATMRQRRHRGNVEDS